MLRANTFIYTRSGLLAHDDSPQARHHRAAFVASVLLITANRHQYGHMNRDDFKSNRPYSVCNAAWPTSGTM